MSTNGNPLTETVKTLEQKIDSKIERLLDEATETKDVVAALKLAIEWAGVKRERGPGWGSGLKREPDRSVP